MLIINSHLPLFFRSSYFQGIIYKGIFYKYFSDEGDFAYYKVFSFEEGASGSTGDCRSMAPKAKFDISHSALMSPPVAREFPDFWMPAKETVFSSQRGPSTRLAFLFTDR